jgi:hypothetical protein
VSGNSTEIANYSAAFDDALSVLPDVYRFGMSGVCREYFHKTTSTCTKTFPQYLELGSIVELDLQASTLPNPLSDELQRFFNSLLQDNNITQRKAQYTSYIQVSVAFTILSLIIASLGIIPVILIYRLAPNRYTILAAILAVFDALLVVTTATLWITASLSYTHDINLTLNSSLILVDSSSFNHAELFRTPRGLYLFALAAIAKLLVLPTVALITVCILGIVVVITGVIIWIVCVCLCTCLGNEPRQKETTVICYVPEYTAQYAY